MNVVVWKRLAEEHREVVRQAPFLLVYGTVERDGAELSVIGHRFAPIADGRGVGHRSHDFR